ncbi:hypothetical protein I6N95_03605 [Vagococcus sp. BWB3-3]|uniref:Holin n=1 Tax=Vagococcus allomyrinae TaxID=2794353 RepID=A0A940SV88_9ENTE|nr:holin [Vagococcus allomyrinae]MBP1040093.1 hypothetical protein [Vagococcus allomyrinae]
MIVQWLTEVNNSYLVALAVLIALVVEGVKLGEWIDRKWLPLVASVIGLVLGLVIALIYQEAIILTCLNGVIAGLMAAGGFDVMKAVWQVPEELL